MFWYSWGLTETRHQNFFFSVTNKNINKNLHRQLQTKIAIRSPSGTIPTYDEKKTQKQVLIGCKDWHKVAPDENTNLQ
jgi:hypothetical protein